jgi:hypothetical protein
MALLNEINADLLLSLSPSASSASSSIGGRGSSTSFDATQVDFSSGLEVGARAFLRSSLRMQTAVDVFSESKERLEKLSSLSNELLELAKISTDTSTTAEQRAQLQTQFTRKISEFRRTLSDAETGGEEGRDILSVEDLSDVLEESGIDASASSLLADTFSRIGGFDGELGFERTRLDNGNVVNPLLQSIASVSQAQTTASSLEELVSEVESDLAGITTVTEELDAARIFAIESYRAFLTDSGKVLTGENPERIANSLVERIRSNASDTRLAEHSDLDRELASELLG